jgi:hypothetical protein
MVGTAEDAEVQRQFDRAKAIFEQDCQEFRPPPTRGLLTFRTVTADHNKGESAADLRCDGSLALEAREDSLQWRWLPLC